MSSTKAKVERALYGPSVAEVALGATLSLVLGVVLGMVYLVLKPVETVREAPETPKVGTVYYQEGSSSPARGRQWLRKRQILLEGGSAELTLNEDELNAWIASSTARPDGQAGGGALFVPQTVNFRLTEDRLQIGLPSRLNILGQQRPVVIQARGRFVAHEGGHRFAADELMIGSLAAHRVPGLTALALGRVRGALDVPEDVREAWRRLERVEVAGAQLHLVWP